MQLDFGVYLIDSLDAGQMYILCGKMGRGDAGEKWCSGLQGIHTLALVKGLLASVLCVAKQNYHCSDFRAGLDPSWCSCAWGKWGRSPWDRQQPQAGSSKRWLLIGGGKFSALCL